MHDVCCRAAATVTSRGKSHGREQFSGALKSLVPLGFRTMVWSTVRTRVEPMGCRMGAQTMGKTMVCFTTSMVQTMVV